MTCILLVTMGTSFILMEINGIEWTKSPMSQMVIIRTPTLEDLHFMAFGDVPSVIFMQLGIKAKFFTKMAPGGLEYLEVIIMQKYQIYAEIVQTMCMPLNDTARFITTTEANGANPIISAQ